MESLIGQDYLSNILISLIPSKGHLPPEKDAFPTYPQPQLVESFSPTVEEIANNPEMVLDLPESWSLPERWLSLVDPPDWVATNIATEGLKLDFLSDPPLSPRNNPPREYVTSDNQIEPLTPFVQAWLKRGILRTTQIPPYVFFSRMFHVKKKNGKLRPVLDLSVLNLRIRTPTFHMETLDKVVVMITQIMWATSLDVTDAYLSVPIHLWYQKYFCFILNGVVYMFVRMPFGLTTAPWAFSRIMRPIKYHLRLRGVTVSSFIDDFLILAVTSAQAACYTTWTSRLLVWLGFEINTDKSSVTPLQEIEYLGILLNLRNLTLALPLDKIEGLLSSCKTAHDSLFISRRELESLVGKLNFAHQLIHLGRLLLNPVIIWMNRHTMPVNRDIPVPIDNSLRTALKPFLKRSLYETPMSFRPLVPSLELMADASEHGWCGVIIPYLVRDT